MNAANLTQHRKAACFCRTHVCPHRQVDVNVDAEIANGRRKNDGLGTNPERGGWKLAKPPVCSTSNEFDLLRRELDSV